MVLFVALHALQPLYFHWLVKLNPATQFLNSKTTNFPKNIFSQQKSKCIHGDTKMYGILKQNIRDFLLRQQQLIVNTKSISEDQIFCFQKKTVF